MTETVDLRSSSHQIFQKERAAGGTAVLGPTMHRRKRAEGSISRKRLCPTIQKSIEAVVCDAASGLKIIEVKNDYLTTYCSRNRIHIKTRASFKSYWRNGDTLRCSRNPFYEDRKRLLGKRRCAIFQSHAGRPRY